MQKQRTVLIKFTQLDIKADTEFVWLAIIDFILSVTLQIQPYVNP